MRRPATRRARLGFGAGLLAATLLAAAPAHAHVEPSITEVPAGSAAELEFVVQHGCDGSPTVLVEFQAPAEVTGVTALGAPGWTGSVDGRVVTFDGGSLPDDEEGTFGIGFTAPDTVGAVLTFPVIQTCEEGSLEWIQTGPDADYPAPTVEVVAADPDAPTPTEPTPTTEAEGEAEPDTAEAPVETTESTATDDPAVGDGLAEDDQEEDGARPYVIAGIVALVAIGGVAVAWWMRRREET